MSVFRYDDDDPLFTREERMRAANRVETTIGAVLIIVVALIVYGAWRLW